eukprot:3550657-Rhodomonas_salina.3
MTKSRMKSCSFKASVSSRPRPHSSGILNHTWHRVDDTLSLCQRGNKPHRPFHRAPLASGCAADRVSVSVRDRAVTATALHARQHHIISAEACVGMGNLRLPARRSLRRSASWALPPDAVSGPEHSMP